VNIVPESGNIEILFFSFHTAATSQFRTVQRIILPKFCVFRAFHCHCFSIRLSGAIFRLDQFTLEKVDRFVYVSGRGEVV
jgi:hypothetical protein